MATAGATEAGAEGGSSSLLFYLNGQRVEVSTQDVQPEVTLLEFIRSRGVTGAKLGCAEGGCGACTVNIARWDDDAQAVRHEAVNACLFPVCAADGTAVFTVDGIGTSSKPHPVQDRVSSCHGSQCGFCTPGIVMALFARLQTPEVLSEEDIDAAMDGNLCRCTGYRPILAAARTFAGDEGASARIDDSVAFPDELRKYTLALAQKDSAPTKVLGEGRPDTGPGPARAVWHRPTTLEEACRIKAEHGAEGKLVAGNTEVGVDAKFRKMQSPVLIFTKGVPELRQLTVVEAGTTTSDGTGTRHTHSGYMDVGGATTLSALKAALTAEIDGPRPAYQCRPLAALRDMLQWFASTQIRNAATLAGNIVTASPISDTCHVLVAMGASVELAQFDSEAQSVKRRRVPLAEFFKGYRKVDCGPNELVVSIRLPLGSSELEFVGSFKQGQRREDDIAICGAGLQLRLDSTASATVRDCTFMFSGMAPLVKRAEHAEAFCRGKTLAELTTAEARRQLGKIARDDDFNLPAGVPGGRPEYRMTLAASFLFKFFVRVRAELRGAEEPPQDTVDPTEVSAAHNLFHHAGSTSEQQHSSVLTGGLMTTTATKATRGSAGGGAAAAAAVAVEAAAEGKVAPVPVADAEASRGLVGKPIMHRSALLQCTGEALYTDDVVAKRRENAFQAAFVYTDRAVASVIGVDPSAALEMEGVKGWVDASDIPAGGSNAAGEIIQDETFFMPLNKPVECTGRILGVVVATTRRQALAAAAAVKVTYEQTERKGIFTIQDAIEADSFHGDALHIRDGDVDSVFKAAASDGDEDIVVVEGEVRIGGQEHFYLETQATCAIPGEDGTKEMHILSSTQAPKGTQEAVHKLLGIPFHKVTVQVKRLGGGFGGKETRASGIAAAVALAAQKLDHPVNIMLDRDEDMKISGGRHPFFGRYKAAARRSTGKLLAAKIDLFSNGGYSFDLSRGVLERALLHVDNAYKWPALHTTGRICRTNLPTNTAFRGFGGPQGMLVGETAIEHLATALGLAADDLRGRNMYTEGDVTPYQMPVQKTQLSRLWAQVKDLANWPARQASVAEFNKAHRWRKRGTAILPTKFGIAFGANFLNQGGALVHVYIDGSVLVTHGGVEMGQGLHTKMTQIAARAFEVDIATVHVAETATDKVPNSSPSAASASSDLYGMAVLQACETIKERLEKFHQSLSEASEGSPDAALREKLDGLRDAAQERADLRNDDYFKAVVNAAYFHRVPLSATGFCVSPTQQYTWPETQPPSQEGQKAFAPFNYFSEGAACCEVEIDVLTGDMSVVHASVVMDVGNSLNSAVDIGQVEGAFIQGLGLFTMEELIWGDSEHPWVRPGQLFTAGPGMYKIPSFGDLPHHFQVRLLDDSPNPRTIHSSKAVGEPPFFLAASAFFAAREAIAAAQLESKGETTWFRLDSPASAERIRMACVDEITAGLRLPADFRARGSV